MLMITTEMQSRSVERSGAWLYLDEIMHRVLNDYTVMLSFVRLASPKISDEAGRQTLDELSLRLDAAVKAFRALAPPAYSEFRRLDEDLERLCRALSE